MHASSSSYSKKIALFWKKTFTKVASESIIEKSFKLPLARIKRLMKVEEDVKMVAAEVPILFSLVTEIFMQELTIRAWMTTEDGRRKILQSNDISFAIKTSSMYDFLIYLIPYNDYGSNEYFLKDQKWLSSST
ncbi:CCAAT- binding transcription factor component [Glugoides intestinalis]